MNALIEQSQVWLDRFAALHDAILRRLLAGRTSARPLSDVAFNGPGDTIYEVDTHVEPILVEHASRWAAERPIVLIAEGLGQTGRMVLPNGAVEADAAAVVIVDPIDGTRELMYDKRSAWTLMGAADNRLADTRLSDIQVAMMGEVPTSKQTLWDRLWAVRGQGAQGRRHSLSGDCRPLRIAPSPARTIDHGFAAVSSFFPGTKVLAALLMERIAAETTDHASTPFPLVFDDQYLSSGGQLYEFLVGHYRFICDMRSLFYDMQQGPKKHCCHPYDLATILVAQEAGIELTDGLGHELDAPLIVDHPTNWAGFANRDLRALIEPVMLRWIDEQRAGQSRQGSTRR